MEFELELKNGKVRQYEMFAYFLLILNILFIAAIAYATDRSFTRYLAIGIVVTSVAVLIIGYTNRKSIKAGLFAKAGAAGLILLFYLFIGQWWAAAIMILLSFLYIVNLRRLVVSVTQGQISYPSFPKRRIAWTDLNNLILKDGMLTIDFKDNRLAQVEVMKQDKESIVDEKEFNEFCNRQLKLSRTTGDAIRI